MNSVDVQGTTQVPYLNQQNNQSKSHGNYSQLLYLKSKHERTKRKDQSWRRLATVNKIAQKSGYNLPNYSEKRTIAELLKLYGEYSYLTGKKLGAYYLSTLDIDIRKEGFPEKLIERLEKNTACLLDFLKVSYDQTKKGLHVDILTPKPLDNGIIYWVDKIGKKWTIGSIQSLGKYVVGEDPNKTFINNGKWYWKVRSNEEVKATLNKFFFRLGNQEKSIEINRTKELKIVPIQQNFKPILNWNIKQQKHTIRAKILSKKKTLLTDIWKVFYLNQAGNQGYFLFNEYQKTLTDLNIGAVKNIMLIQGRKHDFFSKIL